MAHGSRAAREWNSAGGGDVEVADRDGVAAGSREPRGGGVPDIEVGEWFARLPTLASLKTNCTDIFLPTVGQTQPVNTNRSGAPPPVAVHGYVPQVGIRPNWAKFPVCA